MAEPHFDPAQPFTAAPPFDPAQPFTVATPDFTATNAPLPDVSAHAGVPARGRGTQFDLDKANRGVDLATTPLAHPTGIEAIDSFTSPIGLASLAAGGIGVARAGLAGGVTAAAKTAIADASPLIKYEVSKSALEHMGVPSVIAMPLAMAFSGYKKGAKAATAEAEAVSRPGYPRTGTTPAPPPGPPAPPGPGESLPGYPRLTSTPAPVPAVTLSVADEAALVKAGYAPSMIETIRANLGMPPRAVPTPVPVTAGAPATATEFEAARAIRMGPDGQLVGRPRGNPDLPDVKAASEAALAARRAAYQASLQPAADDVVKASGKLHFSAPEWAAFRELRARGVSLEESAAGAKAASALAKQFGSPSAAEVAADLARRKLTRKS